MIYTPIPADYKPIEKYPGIFRPTASHPGKIVRVDYLSGGNQKHAYVYLPCGYDENEKYEILYLMHGGGDRADKFIGTDDTPNSFKDTLDHMIENGDIKPLIVVAPSFYPMDIEPGPPTQAGALVSIFHNEFMNDLIPAVESKYSTYAETTDPAGLRASRDHRAFGGFSMGGVTTWWQFIHSLDVASTFLPLSGDCWVLGLRAAFEQPDATVEAIIEAVKKSGWTPDDFRIFAATGTKDIAFDALGSQVNAMKKRPDMFRYSDDPAEGNFHFILAEGLEHNWEAIWDYCYDILKFIYAK